MSEPASISRGIASRYATALHELAREGGAVEALEGDIETLEAAMAGSADFNALISSPAYGREEQAAAIAAISRKAGLTKLTASALGLMAAKRRLFALPQLVRALREAIAEDKGVLAAEVTSAKALTGAQAGRLAAALKARTGKDVAIDVTVDEGLVGGLIVKVGSKMIDTSIRSRLASLQNAMKEAG